MSFELRRIYNIYNEELTPKTEGLCDTCADTKLTHRSDDNEETFQKRWNTFTSQSEPVITYYSKTEGLVANVDGTRTMSYGDDELKSLLGL